METKAFKGTVHIYTLNGERRYVVDPRSIPSDVRDGLCIQHNYWLPSIIGPNHTVAHYDLTRKAWRDMRNATRDYTANEQTIIYDDGELKWC